MKGLKKVKGSDNRYACLYDSEGNIVEVEYYEPTRLFCGELELVRVRIEDADGQVVSRHEHHRVSQDAYDIHVTDHRDKLRVILHHTDVSRGEPFTICEEWIE